jgi:photosystem II stability/assembly factor-like uncharacterized protein
MKNYILIFTCVLFGSMAFAQSTWYEISTGVSGDLQAIDFPTPSVGYIVGYDTTILKTTDGGQTWGQLGLNGISPIGLNDDFTDVKFIDANIGFIVTGYSGVFKTVDGAQTWSQVGYSMCFPHTTYLFDESNYLVAGGDCFEGAKIDKVVNGAGSQASISTNFWNSNEIVVEMSFVDANRGLAATMGEYMLRTVDGGSNWDTISTNINGFLTSVVMVDDTLCYAGYNENGGGFGILKSVDGGLSWEQDLNSATFFYPAYLSVHAANNGDIYSGAVPSNSPGGLIFESVDGVNWDYQSVDQAINAMASYGSDVTFGVGDSGYLVVNMPIANLDFEDVYQIEFNVYPNPVLDELTINNPHSEIMEVRIFDTEGRIVKSEKVMPGLSKINTSNFSRGMYIVKAKIGNKCSQQRIIK